MANICSKYYWLLYLGAYSTDRLEYNKNILHNNIILGKCGEKSCTTILSCEEQYFSSSAF